MLCRSLRIFTNGLGRVPFNNRLFKRHFLSPAFHCEESWRKRLETPLLKKCVLEDFYYELDNKYGQIERISAIDVDIFVNATTDRAHLDEMQDLVHKLRLSRDSCNMLPSTHHGLIRVLLDCKKFEDLMTILNDRLNYGVFPDDYCSLLMLNVFLKLEDYKNAAKVATLRMLQEDFNNPLLNYLSLYSCHNYLLNPSEWEKVKETVQEEDDEEIKVRVAYLRNPYFDDHFDLTEANDLIGKTLAMIGREMNDDIGRSYHFLGLVLYKKFSLAESFIKSVVQNKQTIHKDVFDLSIKYLEELKQSKSSEPDSDILKSVETLSSLIQELPTNNLLSESPVLPLVEETIKQLVKESESKLITQQQQIYQDWIETRERVLKETLEEIKREDRLAEVQRVKEEMMKKEQELFFFDREDQIDLEIERKDELIRDEIAVRSTSQNKTSSTDDYVPPEIVKQKSTV